MNNKISLWISGNQRRSGYTPILSVNQPPFSCPGYDERKGMQSSDFYFVVKATDDYTQYTLIHNKITTSDGHPNAILKISIGIPAGFCIASDKGPYEVLIDIKEAFVKEYMTHTYGVEGGFSFTDKIVTEDIFVKILDKYELISDSTTHKAMGGTSSKTVFNKDVSTFLKSWRADNDLMSIGELVVAEGTPSATVEAPHRVQPKTVTPKPEVYKPMPPKPRNFKNIIISILAVIVIGQGVFLFLRNDDNEIIAESTEASNDSPLSILQTDTEVKKLDSIDSLAIEIRDSLDTEEVTFGGIAKLHKRADNDDFRKSYPELFDTLGVYYTFTNKLSYKCSDNKANVQGALQSIFGTSKEKKYKIYRKFGSIEFDVACSTEFDDTCKFNKFREKHQIIIANFFVGKGYDPQKRECTLDSTKQRDNYRAAAKNCINEDWQNFKKLKEKAIK